MYNNKLYMIENKTALHVGSGDANFAIIDNEVQRDAITSYPTIHSSSLKGALREYCNYKNKIEELSVELSFIFGDEDRSGKIRFIDAHLLSIPMKSDSNPYYHCVSPKSIEQLIDYADTFGKELENKEALVKFSTYNEADILVKEGTPNIEEYKAKNDTSNSYDFSVLEQLIGTHVALVPNSLFSELLKDLPVIARNQLENGISKNLFYEEVVPRQSKFFTIISEPIYLNKKDKEGLEGHFDRFNDYLQDSDTIHIGANASIGYGVCKFTEVVS